MVNKGVAALVILYNNDSSVIDSIDTYAGQVEILYAYDNSEVVNQEAKQRLLEIPNMVYLGGSGNEGLSTAINETARKAVNDNMKWLITFDQDSRATDNMVTTMYEFVSKHEKKNEIGLIGPAVNEGKTEFAIPITEYSYYDKIIQSGAMHNLEIWEKVGGYDPGLFIYQVDYEYCARLYQGGYKIIKLNTALLIHNVEDENSRVEYIAGKRFYINKYPAICYYYIIRNNLYCAKKYKKTYKQFVAENKRTIVSMRKMVKYEKVKKNKRKAIFYGYLDYYLGNYGKCRRKI